MRLQRKYRELYDYFTASIDDRSYVFFRLSFSLLMIIYSVNKVTDEPLPPNYQQIMFGYQYRMPTELNDILNRFPWYTTSSLYWSIHSPLMLVLAITMSFTYGYIAQISFILFGIKTLITLNAVRHYLIFIIYRFI